MSFYLFIFDLLAKQGEIQGKGDGASARNAWRALGGGLSQTLHMPSQVRPDRPLLEGSQSPFDLRAVLPRWEAGGCGRPSRSPISSYTFFP